jgi:ubiquinone/menaquinone biosynthesis C-methylase UbiE
MGSTTTELPDYAFGLAAYHRAFAAELRAIVGDLPIRPGDRVLDVACGDGFYTGLLAERVGASGIVAAVDHLPAFVAQARRAAGGPRVLAVAASVDAMPFVDAFDWVWCAQSLYSLPDPLAAARAMRRAVRPGGCAAVLENDTLHHVLLPWPVEIELAARAAELAWWTETTNRPETFYIGRRLAPLFRDAGFTSVATRCYATTRQAPLSDDLRLFLSAELAGIRARAGPHLEPSLRARLETLTDPGSGDYLLDQGDLSVTVLNHVVVGVHAAG